MRILLLALLLPLCAPLFAQERPLRFSITESWSMPMIHIENGKATGGILFDLQTRLAQKVGRSAEMLVMPRLRVQTMMLRGELDVRCNTNPQWMQTAYHQYIWSVPFMDQRDLIVSYYDAPDLDMTGLVGERLGTVLGFRYPSLDALFDNGQLVRDEGRTQDLVLEKLQAGRYQYAVSSQLSLDWFNRNQRPEQRLREVAEIAADPLSCVVRDAPDVPTQALLHALEQMQQDGEFEAIIARYR